MTASFTITPIPAFSDNYIWCIEKPDNNYAILVDPGDADVCLRYLEKQQKQLAAILLTHHHADHSAGIEKLRQHYPQIKVFGAVNSRIKLITDHVTANDTIDIAELDFSAKVLTIAGHTLDHIAFVTEQALFCGDTLFHCGCGRLFEGSAEQMLTSLTQLAHLPAELAVYCTHEYTLANMCFALTIEPHNPQLLHAFEQVSLLREQGHASLPTTIAEQLAINPFLRCSQIHVQQQVSALAQQTYTDELSTFTALRALKDQA